MKQRSPDVWAIIVLVAAAWLIPTACSSPKGPKFRKDMREITQFEKPAHLRGVLGDMWESRFLFWNSRNRGIQGRTLGGTKKSLGFAAIAPISDYAWIENTDTDRVVWEMTYRMTEHAGGASKNRLFNDVITLPAGKYVVSGKEDGEVIEVEAEVKAGKLTEIKLRPE